MKKEKHYVNKVYGNHKLARYVDVYEVSTNKCQAIPESGYKGTEVELVQTPAYNERFIDWSITGATLTGNNFILDNDVTAQGNYETANNLTLQTNGHGSISSDKAFGFVGEQATLSNTANNGYGFSGYSITGATLTGNKFEFVGNDVTAKAWFSAIPVYTSVPITNAILGVYDTVSAEEVLPNHTYQAARYTWSSYTKLTGFEMPNWYGHSSLNLNVFANALSVNSITSMSSYATDFTTGTYVLFTTYTNKYINLTGTQSAIITSINADFFGNITAVTGDGYKYVTGIAFSADSTSAKANVSTATGGVIRTADKTLTFNNPIVLTAGQHSIPFTICDAFTGGWYDGIIKLDLNARSLTWNGYISGIK